MKSLALLAVFILALTVLGGPISLLLTLIPQRLLPLAVIKITSFFLALIAILVGVMIIINVDSIGAMILALIGIITGAIAIYRVVKIIPKLNKN
jgi:hypothetical protein